MEEYTQMLQNFEIGFEEKKLFLHPLLSKNRDKYSRFVNNREYRTIGCITM